jgi:hypothetical protein
MCSLLPPARSISGRTDRWILVIKRRGPLRTASCLAVQRTAPNSSRPEHAQTRPACRPDPQPVDHSVRSSAFRMHCLSVPSASPRRGNPRVALCTCQRTAHRLLAPGIGSGTITLASACCWCHRDPPEPLQSPHSASHCERNEGGSVPLIAREAEPTSHRSWRER